MLYSLISAFLMYSRIPMPQIPWEERNRRYALCFFPLVGEVIGGLLIGWYLLSKHFSLPIGIFSIIAVCIPVFVTGGIHLDGFCDVEDARASYGDIPRKLEIMSDPHIGSFAVIRVILYFLAQNIFMAELRSFQSVCLTALSYCLSRTLSGLAAVTFRCAKKNGTLQDFVKPAHRRVTITTLAVLLCLECFGMLLLSPFPAMICLLVAAGIFLYYRAFSYRSFGGITGDTAGWFLQVCELGLLGSIVLSTHFQPLV